MNGKKDFLTLAGTWAAALVVLVVFAFQNLGNDHDIVTRLDESNARLESRISVLELHDKEFTKDISSLKTTDAGHGERLSALDSRMNDTFERVESQFDDIKSEIDALNKKIDELSQLIYNSMSNSSP